MLYEDAPVLQGVGVGIGVGIASELASTVSAAFLLRLSAVWRFGIQVQLPTLSGGMAHIAGAAPSISTSTNMSSLLSAPARCVVMRAHADASPGTNQEALVAVSHTLDRPASLRGAFVFGPSVNPGHSRSRTRVILIKQL